MWVRVVSDEDRAKIKLGRIMVAFKGVEVLSRIEIAFWVLTNTQAEQPGR